MATGLPIVNIEILNNQLGSIIPIPDRTMGIILSGVALTDLALSTPHQLFSLKNATDLGIDAAYDTDNTTDAYYQIKEFYDRAGTGAELWIMLVSKETLMVDICDVANDLLKKLRNAIPGYGLIGITRVPDGAYVPTYASGFDDDARNAIIKAQALADQMASEFLPFRVLISARDYQGVPADLENLREMSNNRVGVMLSTTNATSKNGSVGLALGELANNQVQRKISRVKNGDLKILAGYLTDGTTIEDAKDALNSIYDKGYITFRKFPNKSGYYFSGDATCSPLSDDYSSLARGRVIDKAQVIVGLTYTEELDDDLEVDADGYPDSAVLKGFQLQIEEAILNTMNQPGEVKEISGVRAIINPAQKLIDTSTIVLEKLAILPKGYSTYIDVPLGFESSSN